MGRGPQLHKQTTRVLSALVALIGIVLIIQTILAGGGPFSKGVLIGILFIVAGVGRVLIAGRI